MNETRNDYKTATPCDDCDKMMNCINGRWCPQLHIYVEHLHPQDGKPCQQNNGSSEHGEGDF